MRRKLTVGILAHVDAGKTTLSEALLYISGKIRTLGRVDHKNTYLDTNAVERERGITIFSKQARFSGEQCDFILLDTPGHVDFSAETERVLSLLDYAVLVISATDGVQNHTRTLWQLLEFYQVPTFIFVNKNDISIKLSEELEAELAKALSPNCVAFYETQTEEEFRDKLALVSEDFLESVLTGRPIEDGEIAEQISRRRLFPCLFGSALRMVGVDFLLRTLERFSLSPVYGSEMFGATVYKIARDGAARLTYMKVTGGTLSVRDELCYLSPDGKRIAEKVSQLRLYSGAKFEQVDSVCAGEICAVSGLSETYVGLGLGAESNAAKPVLEPVLSYGILLPSECDPLLYFPRLKELEEEEPSLHLVWNEELRQIEARLMGDIQIDLLKRMIAERFGVACEMGAAKILYKEKAAGKAVGVGHFEPLRHYAEVQLLIEPAPMGTGLVFDSRIPENDLAGNWQRLILSHLYEKNHRGILAGAALTDTKITLVAGKAHLKHTEGGDFREATLRAVRQGLMKSGCVLLEPYCKFRLELPTPSVGRAMADLQTMSASFEVESADGEVSVICGRAPVSEMYGYPREVLSYTGGAGRLFYVSDGYATCHNAEEVVAAAGYDPETDTENPSHSVFCAHGAGFVVPWQEVDSYKHLQVDISGGKESETVLPSRARLAEKYQLSDEELEAIMLREFGPIRRKRYSEPKINSAQKSKPKKKRDLPPQKKMVLVDGYNVIHSWESLKELTAFRLEKARETLVDILCNYAAYTKTDVTVVFDAYLVKDGMGSEFSLNGVRVVFTKQDETADARIEAMMVELGPNYNIRVVTGDRLLQYSAVHSGILRMTAAEFEAEVAAVDKEIAEFVQKLSQMKG